MSAFPRVDDGHSISIPIAPVNAGFLGGRQDSRLRRRRAGIQTDRVLPEPRSAHPFCLSFLTPNEGILI
jgi:hypothetical protein